MNEGTVSDLVRYRLKQSRTALEDAKYLLDGGRSPQSIVNRAYYAMFYAGLALLQKIGKVPSKHTGVVGVFDREFVAKGIFPKELSKDFHKAFELRQVIDYKTTERCSQEKAMETWHKAVRFVDAVQQYIEQGQPSGLFGSWMECGKEDELLDELHASRLLPSSMPEEEE